MNANADFGGVGRFIVAPVVALLALSGCGSGRGSPGIVQNPPIGYAYVTSTSPSSGGAGAVYEYAIREDGSVSPLPQPSISAGINPSAVLVTGNGGCCVYVVNAGDGTISQYSMASDNTLTPLNPATVTNPGMHTFGVAGGAIARDITGNFLYVVNAADDNVAQFSIGSDGQLAPLTPATVATGVQPVSIVTSDESGTYVLNSGAPGGVGSVSQYTKAIDGTLTPANSNPVAAGINPTVLAIDSLYATAYVFSNCDGSQCVGSIRQFTVGGDGALTDTGTLVTTGSHVRGAAMVFDLESVTNYGYLITNEMGVDTENGGLWSFQVGSTGALSPVGPGSLGLTGVAVAQTLGIPGVYVLTTNSGVDANTAVTGGSLLTYLIGAGGGVTLEATTKLSAPYPTAMGAWFELAP
jgi:6-phosphogluconolactonase (cycloisomerase 2 family)